MMQRTVRFPSRLYHFIWRNWDVVPAEDLARFLGVAPQRVLEMARDLGLGKQRGDIRGFRDRLRNLIIRRNWFLLPMSQIRKLVGMTASELDRVMREEDFLVHKLPPKPGCKRLEFAEPTPAQRQAAHRIAACLSEMAAPKRTEPPFEFLARLRRGRAEIEPPSGPAGEEWTLSPRIMHPFDAPHNPEAFQSVNTPLPYLRLLREFGADAIWLPLVLFNAIRLRGYPEFGRDRDKIIPPLRSLVERADRAGLKVYLYICEPRAQRSVFFRGRPALRGVAARHLPDAHHVCTSSDQGRDLVRDSIREICRSVPGIAGLITISASEYPTHCWSHGYGEGCPRCGERRPADVVAELMELMREGVEASGTNGRLIAWNWAWQWALGRRKRSQPSGSASFDILSMPLAADARRYVVRKLPPGVPILINYEYGTRVRCGGVSNKIWEYSLSRPLQGPLAAVQKQAAEEFGREAWARIQISNSTEFLGTPYLPVLNLVAEKILDVRRNGYRGFMGSWIFGGYPSPNLLLARELCRRAPPDPGRALRLVARLYYGPGNVEKAVEAWRLFSDAFRAYPQSIQLQYSSPLHIAPALEWPLRPTGTPSLTYCPSDDPENYCSPYTPDAVARAFEAIAKRWKRGLDLLRDARDHAEPGRRNAAENDYRVAECFWLCCRSLVNHIRFCSMRGRALRTRRDRSELRMLIHEEIRLAQRYGQLLQEDSRLAFEASMQYFVRPLDVAEKIIGLRQLLRKVAR